MYTGSEPAKRVLEHWREWLPKFVKIMPLDYRRALQDLQQQQAKAHLAPVSEPASVAA
jgi:glutamate synthase (NADPH/NADH) large chain